MNEIELLEKLVSFNTTRDAENKEIMDFIEKYLTDLGFKTKYKTKDLIMEIGENAKIGFLGHTDTVEASSSWKTNPYKLTKKNEKLYGLGSCDMKGGIAAILAAISKIDFNKSTNGMKLYFTYDEEIGFGGINEFVENKEKFPENMIIGEPTNNVIVNGSKGLLEFEVTFKGIKAHSSNPVKGDSAIIKAVEFINKLRKFYEETIKKDEISDFEIPYTTMNIGTINGGDAINSVAEKCNIKLDFRVIKEEQISEIIDFFNAYKESLNYEYKVLNKINPFITKLKNVKGINTCNFITEASFIQSNKIILGVGPVNAHEVNEYIKIDCLEKLVEQYKEIIEENI